MCTLCKGLNQIYLSKSTNPNLQKQIYKIKSTKQIVWNVKNQICQTESFPQIKIYQTNSTNYIQ